jgi:hypothetical protein
MLSIRNLPALLAMAAIVALTALAGRAYSTDQPQQSANPKLGTVTIKGQRERKALRRRVDHFVSSVIVSYEHDSLARWDQPVCPLVAGLPRNLGEFILARISQVARAAHAPLAGEHCRANLYVIGTPYPDLLLKKWQARNPGMYRLCNGIAGVKAFMHSRRPIRVWYNVIWTSDDGAAATVPGPSVNLPFFALPGACVGASSPEQGFSYVFIIVDLSQTKGLEIGQLADYVALAGLAQVRPGADPGSAPTILNLFRDPQHAPQALSPWDQALLYSLYTTKQSSRMEVPLIRNGVMARIAPTP